MLRRRPVVVRRGPGLVGTMARTAVVAGTAAATVGAVQGHQQKKAMEAQQEAAESARMPADRALALFERGGLPALVADAAA